MTETPDRSKYPNLFAWWWNLSPFQENARALWGDSKAKKETKAKKSEKKEDDDDEVDLFGDDDDDEAAAELEAKMKKDKKTAEKELNQKSRVVMDIKGYEVGYDFKGLGEKIHKEVNKDGLFWENSIQVVPLAFGMEKLQLSFTFTNRLCSADWVEEQILEKYEEDIQSIDIVEFTNA